MSGRLRVHLVCSVCEKRNYETTKRPEQVGQMKMKKFCPGCKRHTEHRESK